MSLVVRPARPDDGEFIRRLLVERWHGTAVTAKYRLFNVTTLYCEPKPRTPIYCPSPPVVREMDTPVM